FNASELRAELGTKQLAVDFTADWCPTCKVLEATVLTNENVSVWAEQYDTTFIRADLTEDNPEAEALLRSLGSQSIPLVAVFPQGNNASSPIVIRDLFTAGQLEEALGRARQ
ncbi:MAG: thioredoxin family protein, partial [Proteobacteria bacterium]|nr:thioredoxin family protein [Pseudomonadota bacterium]